MAGINEGGCAFPSTEKQANGSHWHSHMGMSLRDYFAAQALTLLAGRAWDHVGRDAHLFETWAKAAYAIADAMLVARQGE